MDVGEVVCDAEAGLGQQCAKADSTPRVLTVILSVACPSSLRAFHGFVRSGERAAASRSLGPHLLLLPDVRATVKVRWLSVRHRRPQNAGGSLKYWLASDALSRVGSPPAEVQAGYWSCISLHDPFGDAAGVLFLLLVAEGPNQLPQLARLAAWRVPLPARRSNTSGFPRRGLQRAASSRSCRSGPTSWMIGGSACKGQSSA